MEPESVGIVVMAVGALDLPVMLAVAFTRPDPRQRLVIAAAGFVGSAVITGIGAAMYLGMLGG